jgi:ferredoxin
VVEDRKGNKTTVTWSLGYACPMGEFPMIMDRNLNCIMCTECFKSCPYDNISLNLRTPIVDTYNPKKRYFDQAGLAAALIALAFLFIIPSIHLPFFEISLIQGIGGPIIVAILSIYFFLRLSKRFGKLKEKTTQDLFNLFSFSIIPIGSSIWFSFWIMRIFDHSLSILKVLADPFGGFFMAQSIYNSSGLILDNPITFPVALFYLLNPLYHLGLHTMDFGPLVTQEFSFAFRIMVVLLGMVASLYSAHRAIFLNWDYDQKKNLKILMPMIAWIIFATFLGLFAVYNQF